MPITATAAIVAAAAMAGVPLLNGFLSKEMFFAEALEVSGPVPLLDRALPYVATAAGMFSVAYSLRFIHGAFFGPDPVDLPRAPHEPPRWMRFPIEALVLACVVVGVAPNLTVRPLLDIAVNAVLGADTPSYHLALWHGFNMPLAMSVLALVGGAVVFRLLRRRLASGVDSVPLLPPIDGRRVFDRALDLSRRGARRLEAALGSRRLQTQLRWIVAIAAAAAFWAVIRRGLAPGGAVWPAGPPGPLAARRALRAAVARGRRVCARRRDPGQVPPPRRARARGRGRARDLRDVRLVFGA